MTRLDISIGPVQGFVAQSRRTRDLWGSSYLLSVLSGHAMHGAERAGGKIVSPIVEHDPLYRWIVGSRRKAPTIGSIPNRFVVTTDGPAEEVADAAIRGLKNAWRSLCNAVWRRIVHQAEHAGNDTGAIWQRQIRSFWEILWTAGDDPVGGGLLARRKHWRSHCPSDEPGDKCTVMHDYQELSGWVRAESRASRERQEEFWGRVRDHDLVGRLNLREDERLCAISMVKRLFPSVRRDLDWTVDASRWPSTVSVGALQWVNRVTLIASREADRYARKVKEVAPATAFAQQPMRVVAAGVPRTFARLDANWLHVDFVRDARLCSIPRDSTGEHRKQLARLLEALYETVDESHLPLGRPSTFFALLKADGDRLGKLVGEVGSERVGKALARFTREVPEIVATYDGVTVYAGGDDVLAMIPVPGALSCAEALSKHYRSAFDDIAGATLSAAVLFARVRSPLRSVLAEATRLLDETAKDRNGRNSLAVGVLKSGGMHCEWVTTWTRRHSGRVSPAVTLLNRLVRRLGRAAADPGLSSSLVYRIRETLSLLCDRSRWEPGTWAHPPRDLDTLPFLRAEIVRSLRFGSKDQAEAEASALAELVEGVLPRASADEVSAAGAVGVDALLLAHFLADAEAGVGR